MMRFMNDFEKAERIRQMGFTLQFLFSMDMLLTATAYYVSQYFGLLEKLDKYIYIISMAALVVSMIPFVLVSAPTFAKIRFVYRWTHMLVTVVIFIQFGHFVIPPYYVVYYAYELVYLHKGISQGEMTFPGQYVTKLMDRYQEAKEQQMETARFPHIGVANEIIRKEVSIDEEYCDDDLFDYYTAFEDSSIAGSPCKTKKAKAGATFIV